MSKACPTIGTHNQLHLQAHQQAQETSDKASGGSQAGRLAPARACLAGARLTGWRLAVSGRAPLLPAARVER